MISILKNVYIDKLGNIVNKCNNTYSTINMKPVDVKDNMYFDSGKEINDKDPKFAWEYQNAKIFFQKLQFQFSLNKYLWLKKLKILLHGHMLLIILMVKKLECFLKKNCERQIKKNLG